MTFSEAYPPKDAFPSVKLTCKTSNFTLLQVIMLALLAFMISGCESLSPADNRTKSGPGEGSLSIKPAAKPAVFRRYEVIGGRHENEATPSQWIKHVRDMYSGEFPQADQLPAGHVLPQARSRALFDRMAKPGRNTLTWIGHASFVLRLDGQTIITDPVLGKTIGLPPFELERLAPTTFDWRWLKRIDAVVVSHADYDHLDVPSLKAIIKAHPGVRIYVPEGTTRLLRQLPRENIHELAWYEQASAGTAGTAGKQVQVIAVPAIHGTRRTPYPANSSHWSGYLLKSNNRQIYFSGDTAIGEVFRDIRKRYGPSSLALVPAGAFAPREFEKAYHVNPKEAAELAQMVGARKAIGIHWGTFALSEDSGQEQKRAFLAAGTRSVSTSVLRIGETIAVK